MFRFYWKTNRKEEMEAETITVKRLEGGSWFSEEFENNLRKTYKVRSRYADTLSVLEILDTMDDTFIGSQPCWQDSSPILWKFLREELDFSLWELPELQQQVLVGPLEKDFPSWVVDLLENRCSEIKEKVCLSKSFSLPVSLDRNDPSQHQRQLSKQKVKSPLQKRRQAPPFSSSHHHSEETLESSSKPNQPLLSQVVVSPIPKGVQTGSLCKPVMLQAGRSPRKLPVHPKGSQKPGLQDRQCLIDLENS